MHGEGDKGLDRGIDAAGPPPAEMLDQVGAERPTDGAGEATPQGQCGDCAPCLLPIKPPEGGKGGVIARFPCRRL
jgi:hypothetical protein